MEVCALEVGLTRTSGTDDVLAIEALTHLPIGFAGFAFVAMDRLQTSAFFRNVKDIAALAPGRRNFGGEIGSIGKQRRGPHLTTIAVQVTKLSTG